MNPLRHFLLVPGLLLLASPVARPQSPQPARGFTVPALYHVGYWVRDVAKSRAFYSQYLGFEEPYHLNTPEGTLQMVVFKVNERQVIYSFNNPSRIKPNGDNLDHLGLETDNAVAMHDWLVARGVKGVKPAAPKPGRIGDLIFSVTDPDGRSFEVTQLEPQGQLMLHQGKSLPATRVSHHLRSATITVADVAASLHFYRDGLGFRVMPDVAGEPAGSVCVQVPDGTDFLRLVKSDHSPAERAVPEYCLTVADAAQTAALLNSRASAAGFAPPTPVTTGPGGRQEISCIDPDGTRVVLSSARP
jgi:catechol 2,3-dioxygenase-like lactoylglutathione lyase family enzyme